MYKPLSLFFILFFCLTQCTIQKRTVNKGYFVQWHLNKKALITNSTEDSLKYEEKQYLSERLDLLKQELSLTPANSDEISGFVGNCNLEATDFFILEKEVNVIDSSIEKNDTAFTNRIFEDDVNNEVEFNLFKKENKIYFDKNQGKKAFKFSILALISAVLLFLTILSYGMPFIFSVVLYVILSLSFFAFAFLALSFLVLAFIKPKAKKTQKAQT